MLADIPGLIEGAHEGAGLGDRFLGHVERCRVLIHLVDGTQDDVARDWRTVRGELAAYGNGLADKPEILALNKIDALDADMIALQLEALREVAGDRPIMTVSGATGTGVTELLRAAWQKIAAARATDREAELREAEQRAADERALSDAESAS